LLAWAGAATLLAAVPGGAPDGNILAVLPALALLGAGWAANQGEPAPARWLDRLGRLQLATLALGIGLGTAMVAAIDLRIAPFGLLALLAAMLMAWRMMVLARRRHWGGAVVVAAFLVAPVYAAIIAGPLTRLPISWIVPRIAGTAQRVAPGLPPGDFGVAGFTGQSLLFRTGRATRLLPDGPAAARFLAEHPGRLAAVADREEVAFRQAAATLGLRLQEAATVISFDLRHGGYVAMLLYRTAG
ncbi:MAG: dolichyl-phosphate-mannose-protein mannosyltransferase, partial [Belnapia sp.]|nr:dolichyl-phosphate-mannose-protein mannosyltransferase [Belnapia sp.]